MLLPGPFSGIFRDIYIVFLLNCSYTALTQWRRQGGGGGAVPGVLVPLGQAPRTRQGARCLQSALGDDHLNNLYIGALHRDGPAERVFGRLSHVNCSES